MFRYYCLIKGVNMWDSEEDEDVFIEDEELGRKIIAEKQYNKEMKEHYDVGYHSGLIGGMESQE